MFCFSQTEIRAAGRGIAIFYVREGDTPLLAQQAEQRRLHVRLIVMGCRLKLVTERLSVLMSQLAEQVAVRGMSPEVDGVVIRVAPVPVRGTVV